MCESLVFNGSPTNLKDNRSKFMVISKIIFFHHEDIRRITSSLERQLFLSLYSFLQFVLLANESFLLNF